MANRSCSYCGVTVIAAISIALLSSISCTSTAPTPPAQPVAPPPEDHRVAAAAPEQTMRPAHQCVTSELSQMYIEDIVRMEEGSSTFLHYCFTAGYQGIDCGDNWEITHAVGHGLSNRERAKCDAVMRRYERRQSAAEAQKKRLDEAYDKRHGLQPAK